MTTDTNTESKRKLPNPLYNGLLNPFFLFIKRKPSKPEKKWKRVLKYIGIGFGVFIIFIFLLIKFAFNTSVETIFSFLPI